MEGEIISKKRKEKRTMEKKLVEKVNNAISHITHYLSDFHIPPSFGIIAKVKLVVTFPTFSR